MDHTVNQFPPLPTKPLVTSAPAESPIQNGITPHVSSMGQNPSAVDTLFNAGAEHGKNSLQQVTTNKDGLADESTLTRQMVDRAKAIINQTKYDPFLQSCELGRLKTEYQKIRYGRENKPDA